MKRRSQGEGTIYQRKDGLWVAQVTLPTGTRKTKYGKTQKAVREWLQSQREAIRSQMWVESDQVTVGEFLNRFMDDVAVHTLRPKTIEVYRILIRIHILPELGDVRVSILRPEQLQTLYSKKLESGLSKRTVQFIHSIIHRALSQALKWGLVSRNVADAVEAPRPDRAKFQTLTVEQINGFLDVIKNEKLYPLFVCAIGLGLRRGELLALMWDCVDFEKNTIQVKQNLQFVSGQGLVLGEPKSEKSRRTIALPGFVKKALIEYKPTTSGLGFVFQTGHNTPYSPRNITRKYKEYLQLAGLPRDIRFHDLRHTNATLLLQAGVSPRVLQEHLGHSQYSVTMDVYAHVLPSSLKEAADKMDEIFKS